MIAGCPGPTEGHSIMAALIERPPLHCGRAAVPRRRWGGDSEPAERAPRQSRPERNSETGLRNYNSSNVANRNVVSVAVERTRNAALIANRAAAVVTPVDRATRRERCARLRGAGVVRNRPEQGIRRGLIAEQRIRATAVVARDVVTARHGLALERASLAESLRQ